VIGFDDVLPATSGQVPGNKKNPRGERERLLSCLQTHSSSEVNTSSVDEASFTATFSNLNLMVKKKLETFESLKSLISAEVQLSLSALLIFLVGSIGFVILMTSTWVLINIALGIIVNSMLGNMFVSCVMLLILNCVCAFYTYRYLLNVSRYIGLSQTLASLEKE
jgi:hypothetical protein